MASGELVANPAELAARALLSRAKDSRTKLVGLDADLVSLASALQYLDIEFIRLDLEVARLSVRVDRVEACADPPPAFDVGHGGQCECRECCLRRMVEFASGN